MVSSSSVDYIGFLKPDGNIDLVFIDDAVSYEPLSPLQLVQYRYEGGDWGVSCVGQETLESYTASKFQLWKDNLLNAFGGCAKAFLPEIKRGYALTNVYDHSMFPYLDPSEEADWQVEHNGKLVKLPRPVAELRVWDASTGSYSAVSARMAGAPSAEEKDTYWQALLGELRKFLVECILFNINK